MSAWESPQGFCVSAKIRNRVISVILFLHAADKSCPRLPDSTVIAIKDNHTLASRIHSIYLAGSLIASRYENLSLCS